MPKFTARLRVYAPNGGLQGSLPFPSSWEMAVPFNDMSSLTLSYPRNSPAIELLDSPCEVAVELRNPKTGTFTEHPQCRFLNLRRAHDLIARPGNISFTMPSYGWQLKKAHFSDRSKLNRERRRGFNLAWPGQIMKGIIDEAQTAGTIPGFQYDFEMLYDSAGVIWNEPRFSGDFDFGQDAWSVLDALTRQGICDWRMNGRTLQMYKPNTFLNRSLANDEGIILHPHVDHMQEPAERTWEDLASRVLVIGDEKMSKVVDLAGASQPWGQWEEVLQAGGVREAAMLNFLGDYFLASGRIHSRLQLTKQMVWRDGGPVPFVDYRPGDFILGRTESLATAQGGNQKEPVRVHQITLSSTDPYGIVAHLTLNDRFTDRQLKDERWLNKITGRGGAGAGGGSGGSGGTDTKIPVTMTAKPPTDLGALSESYFNTNGDPVAMIKVSFDISTQSTTDEPQEMSRYNVYARRPDLPFDLAILGQVEHPSGAAAGTRVTALVGPVDAGYTYTVGAQAVPEYGLPSVWSTTINVPIDYPTTPMPVPSAPLLSSRLSTVKAEWDGLDNAGQPMPPRMSEVQVEAALSTSGPWSHVGDIFQPGSAVIITGKDSQLDWGVGDTLYVRFIARDKVSNFSTSASATQSIVVQGVVGPDIQANSVTANEIAVGTLTAEQIAAHSLTVDRLSVGDQHNLIADPLLSDLGDPDPDNPGQTVGGLNRHRVAAAEANSTTASSWAVVSGSAVMTNGATAPAVNRFPLVNNVAFTPDLLTSSNIARPGLAAQVTRPVTATANAGNIKARMRVVVTGTIPGGSTISGALLARFYDRLGNLMTTATVIATTSFTAADDMYIQSVSGAPVPEGAACIVPYAYSATTGAVPAGVTIAFSQFEVWQENSVYIGDGMVKSPLVAADAITTDKLAANSITAKHSINSAYYKMTSGSGDATIEISSSANYSNQAGIRFNPENPGVGLHPALFISDNAGTGGWDANGMIMMGPETTANSTGRVDMQLAWGVTNTHIKRSWGANTQNSQGIWWRSSDARFQIAGQMEDGNRTNDMFRGVNIADAVNSTVWTLTWGAPNWTYFPVATPAFVDTTNDAANATCLVSRRTATAVRVVSTRATPRMHILAFAGGVQIGP